VGAAHFQQPWDFHGGRISHSQSRVFASGMFFSRNDCTPSEHKTALGDLNVQSKQLIFHISMGGHSKQRYQQTAKVLLAGIRVISLFGRKR